MPNNVSYYHAQDQLGAWVETLELETTLIYLETPIYNESDYEDEESASGTSEDEESASGISEYAESASGTSEYEENFDLGSLEERMSLAGFMNVLEEISREVHLLFRSDSCTF